RVAPNCSALHPGPAVGDGHIRYANSLHDAGFWTGTWRPHLTRSYQCSAEHQQDGKERSVQTLKSVHGVSSLNNRGVRLTLFCSSPFKLSIAGHYYPRLGAAGNSKLYRLRKGWQSLERIMSRLQISLIWIQSIF